MATISGTDAKTWLLSQADFLVKLAGRKLWSDQDVTTAAALLKSADASLADMNDQASSPHVAPLPKTSPASPPFLRWIMTASSSR